MPTIRTPFLGEAYTARSPNLADNRLVNLFAETVPNNAGGKDVAGFFRCPGTQVKATLTGQTGSEVRGLWVLKDYAFAVCGNSLFRVDSAYTATRVTGGPNISGSGPVSMADNGTQIFIACNPDGYIYDYDAQTLVQITDEDFLGAVTVGYLAGSFLYNVPDTQLVQYTAITNGTDIDGLDFSSIEAAPDLMVGLHVDHNEAWMFGAYTIEVYGATADTDNPYQRIQGAVIEQGCAAAFSICRLDNSLFWLGRNLQGEGIVYRANGYTPVPVSTRAIEYAIQQWPTLDDAIAYSYVQGGHGFYVLTSPSGNETWVYDVTTQLWHQRAYLDPDSGDLVRHQGTCHALFNGAHLIGRNGDGLTDSGRILELSQTVYADSGDYQPWLRSWRAIPPAQNSLKRSFQHTLQIDGQTGTGLVSGQGSAPTVLLRWSDDGGHTWSNYHSRETGAIGATQTRVIYRRLGSTGKLRDRVYELSGSDPVPIMWNAALIDIDVGAS
jgi:hypothetical protein